MPLIRVDGFYLYSTGSSLHPLEGLKQGTKFQDWVLPLLVAQGWLETFLTGSVYKLETSQVAGHKLLVAIRRLLGEGEALNRVDEYLSCSESTGL